MKDLTMFYLESCPYCRRARPYMDELFRENPEYANIPLTMVEERQQQELADSSDYYYVPCYYAGKEMLAEGALDKAGVQADFESALAAHR